MFILHSSINGQLYLTLENGDKKLYTHMHVVGVEEMLKSQGEIDKGREKGWEMERRKEGETERRERF